MATPRSLSDFKGCDLEGKKVLLRVDLILPSDSNYHGYRKVKSNSNLNHHERRKMGRDLNVANVNRFEKSLPTIRYLLKCGAKIILCGHIGQPEGVLPDCSLKPLVPILCTLLNTNVSIVTWEEDLHMVSLTLQNGNVVLLENMRFLKQEEKNDIEFARKLSSLADLYVNDDFRTAHRAHASTQGITRFLRPSLAGLCMTKELDWLIAAVSRPERPAAAIVGGLHVLSDIQVVEFLLEKVDMILIGGRLVFPFKNGLRFPAESSPTEILAKKLVEKAMARKVKICLPGDIVVADEVTQDANSKTVAACAIPKGWTGVDIGQRSTERYCAHLDTFKTIIWSGVMGEYQIKKFAVGTVAIAKKLAELSEKGIKTIIGGNDTISAVRKLGLAEKMSHVSTGGAASSMLLKGKQLPGVVALDH